MRANNLLVICYNRPNFLKDLLIFLDQVPNTNIFLFQDGKKLEDIASGWSETNQILSQANCQSKYVSTRNLGAGLGVKTAVDWFFTQVDRGIILEDDCQPHSAFIDFSSQLLELYKDEPKVMQIGGYLPGKMNILNDYFFTRFAFNWGWATWKSRWEAFDHSLSFWPKMKREEQLKKILNYPKVIKRYSRLFDHHHLNTDNMWDIQWQAYIWSVDGVCIEPKVNLVHNRGLGAPCSSHTNLEAWKQFNRSLPENLFQFSKMPPSDVETNVVHEKKIIQAIFQNNLNLYR